MIKPQIPENEAQRLISLQKFDILDSAREQEFDDMVEVAGLICGTPIALISLVDRDRQWFKAKLGIDASETARELAFCAHAINGSEVFKVENAVEDDRFRDNPLVTGGPNIRFYAGAPLLTQDDHALGTLCVIDSKPHALSHEQITALQKLARQVVRQIELRSINLKLSAQNSDKVRLLGTLSHDLRSPFNGLIGYSDILKRRAGKMNPEQITQIAEHISTASRSAFDQLENLLSWCKSEMNAVPNNIRSLSLLPIFANLGDNLKAKAREKNIELCFANVDDTQQVLADPDLLNSVLFNLVTNAIKFSLEGNTVDIQVCREPTGCRVSVIDRGVGLDDKQIEAICISQHIQSNRGTAGEKGSGLGLILVKDHLARMNSHLDVTCQVEPKQTCFSFLLDSP